MKSKDKEVQVLYEMMVLGDDEARTDLWMAGADMVEKLAGSMTSKRTILISYDDAVQEGMLAVGESLDTFDPGKGSYYTHMWHKARNAMLDANARDQNKDMSRSKTRQEVVFLASDDVDEDVDESQDVERIVLGDEVWAITEGLLTHEEMNVISLRYIEGDSYREAGYKLSMPYKTVEFMEKRALDKIRYAISV